MPAFRTGRTVAALLTLAALTLTGCVPEPEPSASASATASATARATPSATPSASAPASAADCVIGDWTTSEADLVAYYDQVNAALAGAGATFTPAGSAGLSMRADGTYSWLPDVQLTADVAGTQILIDIAGSIDGSYTVSGDTIATQNDSTENLQISATIAGVATDPGTIGDQIGGAPLANATFTCSPSTLVLTSSVGDAPVTTTLHR
ncbi:hypothetical protein [uncultured Microbacterium sp.]|uniref:hypothetical protein n=1 Tax=uncultured Microbacterium sp. TaxID=191216 RepID=UPI0026205C12|nr:hypothetical protein [uncultured Microbacterium sp.]